MVSEDALAFSGFDSGQTQSPLPQYGVIISGVHRQIV
jgi:hypothetical protein